MKIGIIVAMGKELQLLLPLLENRTEAQAEGRTYYTGQIGGNDIFLLQCGIGKVNAALSTDMLVRLCRPDLVVNSGVAGGADASMHVLDLLVADTVAYHDVWCGPGTEWGAASGCDTLMTCSPVVLEEARKVLAGNPHFREGLICSGDIFVSKAEEVAAIKSHFPQALAVDMESGAVAQVCSMHSIPFSIIRVVSDTPGQAENISQYENFWTDAPRETFSALVSILSNL